VIRCEFLVDSLISDRLSVGEENIKGQFSAVFSLFTGYC